MPEGLFYICLCKASGKRVHVYLGNFFVLKVDYFDDSL